MRREAEELLPGSIVRDQPPPILPRGAGNDGGEDAVEVALVGEANLQGDPGDGHVGGQEFAGAFDPKVEKIAVGREAGGGFEAAGEMGGADPGDFSDPRDGQVATQVFAHKCPGSFDPGFVRKRCRG